MTDWTAAEDATLCATYHSGITAVAARLPRHTRQAIQRRATHLRLTRPKQSADTPWAADEDAVIRRHYPASGSDITDMLPERTPKAIRLRAARLGVRYRGEPRGLLQYAQR
jgi:hypothetical protein